jgi:hypothetical protein
MNNFVVYAHYSNNKLFYIGEGRPNRAYNKTNRNGFWKRIYNKSTDFKVVILKSNLTKQEALHYEKLLIEIYKKPCKLTNICLGSIFESHWMLNVDKTQHPFYGKKRPEISKQVQCLDTGKIFNSIREANLFYNKPKHCTSISDHLSGKTKQAFGYTWKLI